MADNGSVYPPPGNAERQPDPRIIGSGHGRCGDAIVVALTPGNKVVGSELNQGESMSDDLRPQDVTASLRAHDTVSFASYQNSVPVVHSLCVRNHSEGVLKDLVLTLSAEPAFCDPVQFRLESLGSGEERDITTIALKPRHAYLAGLTDTERGSLHLQVTASGESVAAAEHPIAVLAYDEWGGTRSIPELLAAFSLPNNPHVDRILAEAATLLSKGKHGYALNGYDSKSREAVWAQISAVYSAIAARDLKYSMPPASFVGNGQKIRTPDRIFTGGVGTCLDLTMLMVACLEQLNLNPIILLKEGHAWVGCWLINTSFPTCLIDDPQVLRKRMDSGELVMFESTVLAHRPVPKLRAAQDSTKKYLQEQASEFAYAIDLRRARIERIEPLPSRDAAPLALRAQEEVHVEIDETPDLPILAADAILLDENERIETPQGRLTRWKSKLLDLTLRNRLLNFKPTKATIPLRVPDAAHLEDTLSDDKEWKFKAMPPIMDGNDPRSALLAQARTGKDPVEEMARQAVARHELLAELDAKKLDGALYEIFLAVRNGLEESGANTLFLALGFLRWSEEEKSKTTHLAPLLLVPVTLHRSSVRSGFSIRRHDDDAIVNPTLLQMMKERFGITMPNMDPPPADEKGVDVPKVWAAFREAAKEIPGWEVVGDVYLGIFSFHKYVMYTDLAQRAEALRKSQLVSHLIDRPNEPFADIDIRQYDDLDDTHIPGELLTVSSTDGSQLNALRRAADGHSFVLKGPPGTGKSQTITNLIADALGKGKRVLFVSEKMAALEVVERRLNDVGLGPFCLQLHSAKAVKTEVLSKLKGTLQLARSVPPSRWDIEIENLTQLRRTLNGLVRALHKVHGNGLTVRGAIDTAIRYREWPERPIGLASIDALDEKGLGQLAQLSGRMQAITQRLVNVATHPLRTIRKVEYSNEWEQNVLAAADALLAIARQLQGMLPQLGKALDLSLSHASMRMLADIETLSDVLLTAGAVPSTISGRVHESSVRRWLETLRSHGEARNAAWLTLAPRFKADAARLPAIELQEAWTLASAQWFIPKWFGQRAVATRLMAYTLDTKRPTPAEIPAFIEALDRVNREDAAIKGLASEAGALLDSHFKGIETDWEAVQRYSAWGQRLEAAMGRFVSPENPQPPAALVQRIRALVTQGRDLLSTGGALTNILVQYRRLLRQLREASAMASELAANPALVLSENDDAPAALDRVIASVAGWSGSKVWLRDWCFWQAAKLSGQKFGLGKIIETFEAGTVASSNLAAYIDYCYQVWWLKAVMDRDEALRQFNSADHERQILEFREADERFQKLTRDLIRARLAAKVPVLGTPKPGPEMALLSREIQKQRAHIPIRKLVRETPNLLPSLVPCLLMSPLSVAQYLDPAHPAFDLVIFDESSQITVWDAVGAIARGKQAILAGDAKQLPPSAFFERGGSDDEDNVDGDDAGAPIDLESILDECIASGMPQLSLDWHYRSKHESLIAFSNHRYYESRLVTFPSPVTQDHSVRLIPVNGIYGRGTTGTNEKEADAVVKRLVEHFQQADPHARAKTMGVVTFNSQQARLIEQRLDAKLRTIPGIEERMAEHGSERPFVKNLENVQGDERDIILFSTTFGEDAAGRRSLNFGPINNSGGERRLNVAITRARELVEIYTSLRPEDIDLTKTRAAGVRDLKAYLDYALRGPGAIVAESTPTGREPDSPFEREVIQVIRDAGWEVHPQVGCSGFRIDIGVVDQGAPGRYLLGVECDGATYHSMACARDRDRLRQSVLEDLGWNLTRIWSTDWWTNRSHTVDELLKDVRRAQCSADESRQTETTAQDEIGETQ